MEHFVGLDVSVRETSVRVIDGTGKLLKSAKVPTEPEAIASLLAKGDYACKRVGLEAGPMSQWLYAGLAAAGLPVICVEAQHMRSALAAQRNKTDRNDARGIAQMMRVGLYRPVHVKTMGSQERRLLLTARKLLQAKLLDIEADLRGTLKNFGLRVGVVGQGGFRARVRELVDGREGLSAVMSALLVAHEALKTQYNVLHKRLLDLVRDDPLCRRLMTTPGVGPVIALTFQATVDVPTRFPKSRLVGAHSGLTPKRYASGKTDHSGRVSKCGDAMMRTALFEGAQALLVCTKKWCSLKAWGMAIARRRGTKRAIVAVARKLAVIPDWRSGVPQGTEGEVSAIWKLTADPHLVPARRGLDVTARPSDPMMRRPECRPRREVWPLGTMLHANTRQEELVDDVPVGQRNAQLE